MIKLQVIGNLGKDCITNTVNGKSVMNFNVAHTEKFRDSQGVQKDKTIWVECAYWSDRTAVAPYLKKGTQVYVEGNPEVRTYTKNDGTTGVSLTLRGYKVCNCWAAGAIQETVMQITPTIRIIIVHRHLLPHRVARFPKP